MQGDKRQHRRCCKGADSKRDELESRHFLRPTGRRCRVTVRLKRKAGSLVGLSSAAAICTPADVVLQLGIVVF
jgi:hypothetical protein